MDKKIVIFDLDGTLALIDKRRALATKDGKMNWDVFFHRDNIKLDDPNTPVIKMAQMLKSQGFTIVIFSGRSKVSYRTTRQWLIQNDVPPFLLILGKFLKSSIVIFLSFLIIV